MPLANSGTAYNLGSTPVKKLYRGATQVWPQAPILTSISPTSMLHLSGAITLTATGNNFVSGCVLQIKGTGSWTNVNASTVVSKTQMTGSVDMPPGNYVVRVLDAQGRATAEKSFQGQHDTPTLSTLSPTSMNYQDAPQRLSLTGIKFYGAGSGYTGLHLFMQPQGGAWVDKGQMTVTSSTAAYMDGIDPSPVGNHQVMVGYDNPNTTRSSQLTLPVIDLTPTVTSADGSIDMWMAGTIYLTGTNFKAPMTCNLGQASQQGNSCDVGEDYAIGSSSGGVIVDSPTTAHIGTIPYDGHYSTATVDGYHKVRVTTPDGTSAWLDNQPVWVG